jgi:anti-sigma factor ChrR (cupin superfamily)
MQEISVAAGAAGWERAESYPAGTMRKVLRRDGEGKPLAVILRLPPGFEMDDHSHTCVEQHFVISGEYEVANERCGAGHDRMIPAHAQHGPFRSPRGAEVLVVWEP